MGEKDLDGDEKPGGKGKKKEEWGRDSLGGKMVCDHVNEDCTTLHKGAELMLQGQS